MASNPSNNPFESTKIEQIIPKFFAKTLHIILESRSPYSGDQSISSPCSSSSSSSSIRTRDKCFNLALPDCPAAFQTTQILRESQTDLESMTVDIVLRSEQKTEKLVERWIVQYGSTNPSRRLHSTTLAKKLILLLRSLYATIRLLPAYKIFRKLNSSALIQPIQLGHRISSFLKQFTRREESEMQKIEFTPVENSIGKLTLSVFYKSSLNYSNYEPCSHMAPNLIPNYVGSPLADPLMKFGRSHSWSYNDQFAPSPTSLESPVCRPSSHGLPPMSLPRNFTEIPSPVFSASSSSPSQQGYFTGKYVSQSLLRSESAPLSIPSSRAVDMMKQNLPHSPLKDRPSISMPDRGLGLSQTHRTSEKISSNSSVQKSFSRNSSKLSYQDDYDDSVFCGPFILDDDDFTDPRSRPGSYDQTTGHQWDPIRKTQDATISALHHMLKKAPPLHQNLTDITNSSSVNCQTPEQQQPYFQITADSLSVGSSFILVSKTTNDALEELRTYKEIKDLLLRQGGSK